MSRSLTITWEDPVATFEEGKKLAKPIDYLRAMVAGKLLAHGTTTCVILG